jgi:GNAT superfamily N-acetyltransferase
LVALMPGEPLASADATRVLWADPDGGVVLGPADGSAAISVIVRHGIGFVRFLAVAPERRRRGVATALLEAGRDWLSGQGASDDVVVGAEAPFYLWPGVDTRWTEALSFFEAAGFARAGVEMNMTCSAAHMADPPAGVGIGRVSADDDSAAACLAFVGQHWPNWVAEAQRGIDLGTCFLALDDDGEAVGFIAHSVNRVGWLGPMGTDPVKQRGGVGTALVAAVCADARAAGRDAVEVAWVGPVGFYVKAVGAVVSRTFVLMRSRSSR